MHWAQDCPRPRLAILPPAQKSWQTGPLEFQFLFAFFFGAREDQLVLLRSRATCLLSRIFSEILQDRHRPPSDLADGLMRNSSSGQNGSLDREAVIPIPWAGISRGGSPLHGKLNFSHALTSYAG
jgi:hypothetical protein